MDDRSAEDGEGTAGGPADDRKRDRRTAVRPADGPDPDGRRWGARRRVAGRGGARDRRPVATRPLASEGDAVRPVAAGHRRRGRGASRATGPVPGAPAGAPPIVVRADGLRSGGAPQRPTGTDRSRAGPPARRDVRHADRPDARLAIHPAVRPSTTPAVRPDVRPSDRRHRHVDPCRDRPACRGAARRPRRRRSRAPPGRARPVPRFASPARAVRDAPRRHPRCARALARSARPSGRTLPSGSSPGPSSS